jgi:hypothetical protein
VAVVADAVVVTATGVPAAIAVVTGATAVTAALAAGKLAEFSEAII